MDYQFDYSYAMDNEAGTIMGVIYIIYRVVSLLLALAGYFLFAWGTYSIAERRGITNSWLAWIPFANMWILGSISDQYRYVNKGQIRNKRKILVILEGAIALLAVTVIVVLGVNIAGMVPAAMDGMTGALLSDMFNTVMWTLLLGLLICGVVIAFVIVFYIALYDLFDSLNPSFSVLFLVLSIFLRFLAPFFIFFNRDQDAGMPPRYGSPAASAHHTYAPPTPTYEDPWENAGEE